MLSRRDVLVFLIGVGLAAFMLYMRPTTLFSCEQTMAELQILEKILVDRDRVFTDFSSVTRAALAFLLRGCYISEQIDFEKSVSAFPLSLTKIRNGHAGFSDDTLFLFFRKSKTIVDFVHDALVWQRSCKSGRVYAGPANIASAVRQDVNDLIEKYPVKKVVLTGVSLGGAVAAILADGLADMYECSLIVFNCYQFGDRVFRENLQARVKACYSVRNINDLLVDPIDSSIGIKILFDRSSSSKSGLHCEIAPLLCAIGDDTISDRAFYFSDECAHETDVEDPQEEHEDTPHDDDPMSPLTLA